MKHLLLLLFFIFQNYLSAQRSYTLQQLDAIPVIDGVATDSAWLNVPETGDFTTTLPRFGQTPQQNTYVQMGYANGYVFILARCQSQSVRTDGSGRDDAGQADFFTVSFDTWNDDQQAYQFTVTAAGQMMDSNEGASEFDALWAAATHIESDGWTVEMAIPFAMMRYPAEVMDWGLQFSRFDRSTGETSTWNPENPLIIDNVWQFGSLDGPLMNARIKSRTLTVYSDANYHKSKFVRWYRPSSASGAGFDGQWALGSATTLDIAVVSGKSLDMSSASSLNILDYATYSNRPFTATGASLYRRFNASIEGSTLEPQSYYNQATAKLQPGDYIESFFGGTQVNDIKITHRTRNNWRFGTINTNFSPPGAVIVSSTGTPRAAYYYGVPFSNFSTAEKLFRNNSWFNVSLASTVRGNHLNRNILIGGGQWRDRSNNYEISGNWYINLQNASVKRLNNLPDGELKIRKINGAWRYGVEYSVNGPQNRYNVFSSEYPVNPEKHPNFLSAFVSKHNYQPQWSRLNNVSQGIRINTSQAGNNGIYNTYQYLLNLQNRHFQQFSFLLSSAIGKTKEILNLNSQISLQKTVYAPISLNAGFTTDLRKTTVISNFAKWTWAPLSDSWMGELENSMLVKLNNRWNLRNNARLFYHHNKKLVVQNTSNLALLQVLNSTDIINSLSVNYVSNRFSAHRLSLSIYPADFNTNERIYAIENDLTLTTYPLILPSNRRIGYLMGLNSTIWGKAGTRYELNINWQKQDVLTSETTLGYDPDVLIFYFSLSFIHNFVKHS